MAKKWKLENSFTQNDQCTTQSIKVNITAWQTPVVHKETKERKKQASKPLFHHQTLPAKIYHKINTNYSITRLILCVLNLLKYIICSTARYQIQFSSRVVL